MDEWCVSVYIFPLFSDHTLKTMESFESILSNVDNQSLFIFMLDILLVYLIILIGSIYGYEFQQQKTYEDVYLHLNTRLNNIFKILKNPEEEWVEKVLKI